MTRSFALLLLISSAGTAWSAERPIAPARVCDDGAVDKAILAAEILEVAGVPRRFEVWAEQAKTNPYPQLHPRERLLVDPDICSETGARCDKKADDAGKLRIARDTMLAALTMQDDVFENVTGTSSALDYFTNSKAQLRCKPTGEPSAGGPGAPPSNKADGPKPMFRVRGNADALISRQDDPSFSTADKATFSLSQDDVKEKRARKVAAVVGMGFPMERPGTFDRYDVVPYVGVNEDIAKVAGKSASVTTDTRQIGLLFDAVTRTSSIDAQGNPDVIAHVIGIRPQYLWNVADDSRLFTAKATYMPISNTRVNADIPIGQNGFWYHLIFDARFDHGHYTDMGRRKVSDSEDFDRLGSQVGFSILHDATSFPWTWTTTETYLHGFSGSPSTIAQFKSTFTYYFGTGKLAGIDLTYVNGRNEDTTEREQSWIVAFGLKY